jgi:hypothetical protein
MRICDTYSHLFAADKLKVKKGILDEIESIVTDSSIVFGRKKPKEIRAITNHKFNQKGWADKIRVGTSRLTISFLKSKVGVCFQLGNVARTYADILKLAQMGKKNVIEIGVIIVPLKVESKKLGANYAQFERLSSEIKHFQNIINIPILIIGLSN